MTEEANIISNLITVSPVVGVLIYFIMYFQKVIKGYKEELKTKDELIQRLNDERKETATEIVAFGRDINTTLEKLIERLTP